MSDISHCGHNILLDRIRRSVNDLRLGRTSNNSNKLAGPLGVRATKFVSIWYDTLQACIKPFTRQQNSGSSQIERICSLQMLSIWLVPKFHHLVKSLMHACKVSYWVNNYRSTKSILCYNQVNDDVYKIVLGHKANLPKQNILM